MPRTCVTSLLVLAGRLGTATFAAAAIQPAINEASEASDPSLRIDIALVAPTGDPCTVWLFRPGGAEARG